MVRAASMSMKMVSSTLVPVGAKVPATWKTEPKMEACPPSMAGAAEPSRMPSSPKPKSSASAEAPPSAPSAPPTIQGASTKSVAASIPTTRVTPTTEQQL